MIIVVFSFFQGGLGGIGMGLGPGGQPISATQLNMGGGMGNMGPGGKVIFFIFNLQSLSLQFSFLCLEEWRAVVKVSLALCVFETQSLHF